MVLRRLRVPPMAPMSTRRAPRCVPMSQDTAREASPLLKLNIAEVERQKKHRRLRRKTWLERGLRAGISLRRDSNGVDKKCECLVFLRSVLLSICALARDHACATRV